MGDLVRDAPEHPGDPVHAPVADHDQVGVLACWRSPSSASAGSPVTVWVSTVDALHPRGRTPPPEITPWTSASGFTSQTFCRALRRADDLRPSQRLVGGDDVELPAHGLGQARRLVDRALGGLRPVGADDYRFVHARAPLSGSTYQSTPRKVEISRASASGWSAMNPCPEWGKRASQAPGDAAGRARASWPAGRRRPRSRSRPAPGARSRRGGRATPRAPNPPSPATGRATTSAGSAARAAATMSPNAASIIRARGGAGRAARSAGSPARAACPTRSLSWSRTSGSARRRRSRPPALVDSRTSLPTRSGCGQSERQGDEAAHRPAEDVGSLEPELGDHPGDVAGEVLDRERRAVVGRVAHPAVVEQDQLAARLRAPR